MKRWITIAWLLPTMAMAQGAETTPPAAEVRQITLENKPWKGDFDEMLERRVIRFLVPYSRTLYFSDKGHERGVTAELAREFEGFINRQNAKKLGKRPITVILIPTTRDKLLSNLIEGLGDVAAGNLTATPDRLKIVDFVSPPDLPAVRELLITGPASPAIPTLGDLSGKQVFVRPSSSYHESLAALNVKLAGESKPPVDVKPLPDALEDEDILEMVNAGVLEFAVVDDWLAKMWAQVLPKIQIRKDIVLREEAQTGWALRPGSPKLKEVVGTFYRKAIKKQGGIEYRLAKFHKRVKQISNNTKGPAWKRYEQTIALFQKYGEKYQFDPLMLVAQGFQESRLDQNAKSHVGAVGVMQVMPATGKELRVGDIGRLEPNIHAGAKYMDQLMTRFFPDANFSEANRPLFAFASYNAGPGNISRMRKLAKKQGLDPDRWFNNVEVVTAKRIGIETTTYVRNIFKYYAAYTLTLEAQEAQRKARESMGTK